MKMTLRSNSIDNDQNKERNKDQDQGQGQDQDHSARWIRKLNNKCCTNL